MKFVFFTVFCLVIGFSYSQINTNVTPADNSLHSGSKSHSFISIGIMGISPPAGIIYERLFGKFSAEVGLGIFSVGGGLLFLPDRFKFGRVELFSGIKAFHWAPGPDAGIVQSIYLPVGAKYWLGKSLFISADIGVSKIRSGGGYRNENNYTDKITVFGGGKIGVSLKR